MGPVLVTGGAGFIGYHLCSKFLDLGLEVHTVDNLNDYYSPQLKEARLARILAKGVVHHRWDLNDLERLDRLFRENRYRHVVHLAAQAGVRYSLTNPHAYAQANLVAFLNVLDTCRLHGTEHLVFASSSSVYGSNTRQPYSTHHAVDHPVSLYGATKKANEVMAHSYAAMFGLPVTGLRFFTVYGPWGRPDMALFKFARAILRDEEITVYNHGRMQRDFTYVEDIVEGIYRILQLPPQAQPDWNRLDPDPATSFAPYRLLNIGNSSPVDIGHFIELIEQRLGRTAKKNYLPLQLGDVPATFADVQELEALTGFSPGTSIAHGVDQSLSWYLHYRQENPDV